MDLILESRKFDVINFFKSFNQSVQDYILFKVSISENNSNIVCVTIWKVKVGKACNIQASLDRISSKQCGRFLLYKLHSYFNTRHNSESNVTSWISVWQFLGKKAYVVCIFSEWVYIQHIKTMIRQNFKIPIISF